MRLEGVRGLQARSEEAGKAVPSATVEGPAAKEASKRGEGAWLDVVGAVPHIEEGLARGHEAAEEGNGEEPHAAPHAKPAVARRQPLGFGSGGENLGELVFWGN